MNTCKTNGTKTVSIVKTRTKNRKKNIEKHHLVQVDHIVCNRLGRHRSANEFWLIDRAVDIDLPMSSD
jgi:hypothetical protein